MVTSCKTAHQTSQRPLKENTKRMNPKPAKDSELFTFAVKPDWKETLAGYSAELSHGLGARRRVHRHRRSGLQLRGRWPA